MSTNQFKGAKTMPIGIEKSQLTRFLGYHSNVIICKTPFGLVNCVYQKKKTQQQKDEKLNPVFSYTDVKHVKN